VRVLIIASVAEEVVEKIIRSLSNLRGENIASFCFFGIIKNMEKPVVLKNKRERQLIGILHLPKGNKKWPLVVFSHGFGSSKTKRKYVKLARALEKNGIASFRFDFEGCGDSEGELQRITAKRCVFDLESAIKWVLRQNNINKNKIALLGSSFGAVVITVFITWRKFPAKALVLWAPALNQRELMPYWYTKNDLKKWRKQGYFIRKEKKVGVQYLKENQDKDYSLVLDEINTPILIIHSKKDEVIPIKFSKKIAKDYRNVQLKIYQKADHKFEDCNIQQKLVRDTIRWLKKYL